MADAIGLHYEPEKMKIPTLLLAATENDVIIPDGVQRVYDMIDAEKVAALRENAAHGEMLYYADGYVTAWFMWQLKGDEDASKAFAGDKPEIMNNPLYQDQQISIDD